MNKKFHPAAEIFPLMEGEELHGLVEDIRTNGLRDPIVLDKDEAILDGRNRYRACVKAGVKPRFTKWNAKGSEVDFVVSCNMHRRHLTPSQRAMVADKIAAFRKGDNQHAQICAPSQKGVGQALRVSRRSVQAARKVREHGVPELATAVERGDVSVSAAADITACPEEDQRRTVAAGASEVRAKAKQVRAQRSREGRESEPPSQIPDDDHALGEFELLQGNFLDSRVKIPDASINLILTAAGSTETGTHDDLSSFSARVLRPGGHLIVRITPSELPDVLGNLQEHMLYRWMFCAPCEPVTFQERAVQIASGWNAIVWLTKGKCGPVTIENDALGSWAGGIDELVRVFTESGSKILDPLCGDGSTGVVAVRLGRHFTGIDPSADAIARAEAQLKSVSNPPVVSAA